MTHPFTGAGVALITPFNEDKSIDYSALERLIEDQIQGGIDYLVVLGTTGETPALSDIEKKEIVRFVIEKNAGRLKIVVGMGGNDTVTIAFSPLVSMLTNFISPYMPSFLIHTKILFLSNFTAGFFSSGSLLLGAGLVILIWRVGIRWIKLR